MLTTARLASSALRCTISPLRSATCARPLAALKPSCTLGYRFCSSKAEETPAAPVDDGAPKLLFEGAKAKIVKTLKMASIANLGFAALSVPLLQYITSATGAGGKGAAMSALLLSFGGATTGALTYATSTYALTVVSVPGKEAFVIETPTLTGGTVKAEVAWSDVTRPLGYHPFATFEAKGSKYYLDELGEMHDDTFMEKLEEAINK